jgi:hypothetical protein
MEKSMMRWLALTVIVTPLLIGSGPPCPEPNTPDIGDCPFAVDPNMVVGKLLDCVRLEVGQQFMQTRTWCDPEGDPAKAEILAGPEGVRIINKPKVSSYTLLWTPRQPMTVAIVVRVTDEPAHGQPKSADGTILIQVVPRGRRAAPRLCGGPPQ